MQPAAFDPPPGTGYFDRQVPAGFGLSQVQSDVVRGDRDRHWRTLIDHREFDSLPASGQGRGELQSIFRGPDSAKAPDDRLPVAAEGRHMDAGRSVTHSVCQIDCGALPEVAERLFAAPQPARDHRMNRWAERRPMSADRSIVVKIRFDLAPVELVAQQVHQHYDIGLLDHLGLLDAVSTEYPIGRNTVEV